MKTVVYLFICLTISLHSYSQDSSSIIFLQKTLNESYPKRRFSLVETTTDNYKNTYQFDKKTKGLFNLFSNKLSHDTSFTFFYLKEEVAFCELIIWPDPKKKKGLRFRYYVNNGNLIPLSNQKQLNPVPLFLIEKGAELYKRGNSYLLLNQTN
jgi:hypothetical protein